jgi:hypothetical protein
MKNFIYLLLFISHNIFSQQIPFKITGTYEDGLIKKVNVHRNPTFSIDTIIINKNKFVLTGKLDYPMHIEIGFNDFQGARGVYTDGKTINVIYKNKPNLIDSKVIQVSLSVFLEILSPLMTTKFGDLFPKNLKIVFHSRTKLKS